MWVSLEPSNIHDIKIVSTFPNTINAKVHLVKVIDCKLYAEKLELKNNKL